MSFGDEAKQKYLLAAVNQRRQLHDGDGECSIATATTVATSTADPVAIAIAIAADGQKMRGSAEVGLRVV